MHASNILDFQPPPLCGFVMSPVHCATIDCPRLLRHPRRAAKWKARGVGGPAPSTGASSRSSESSGRRGRLCQRRVEKDYAPVVLGASSARWASAPTTVGHGVEDRLRRGSSLAHRPRTGAKAQAGLFAPQRLRRGSSVRESPFPNRLRACSFLGPRPDRKSSFKRRTLSRAKPGRVAGEFPVLQALKAEPEPQIRAPDNLICFRY